MYTSGKLPANKCEIIFCSGGLAIILAIFVEFVEFS